jgi:hypothetical protein
MVKEKNEQCVKCGQEWNNATFLSETFNYSGGTMHFECKCGNTTKRDFLPSDLLRPDELCKIVLRQEGFDEDFINSVIAQYNSREKLRQIMNGD